MDAPTFIVQMTESLAWPITVFATVILLRSQILALIPRLRQLRLFDTLEAGFSEGLASAARTAEVAQLPAAAKPSKLETPVLLDSPLEVIAIGMSPATAMNREWVLLMEDIQARLSQVGYSGEPTPETVERELVRRNLLPETAPQLLDQLSKLRDRAIMLGDRGIQPEQALDFVRLVRRLRAALSAPRFERGSAASP